MFVQALIILSFQNNEQKDKTKMDQLREEYKDIFGGIG